MSGFTFAAGNVSKLTGLPLYGLGALACAIIPRSRKRWVIGCGIGLGEGALPLYRYAAAADPCLVVTWLARDLDELADARALGMRAVLRSSRAGFWQTARASVIAVTHGFGDANRYGTRGGFVVQLWHGIPLKLIQLDSVATWKIPRMPGAGRVRTALRRAYRRQSRRIGLLPAASELAAARLRTAFGVPGSRVAVTGDPRNDVLSAGEPAARRAAARDLLGSALGRDVSALGRIVLYAPTWRDGDVDPAIPSPSEWSAIVEWLAATSSTLMVRPHPHGVGDYADGVAASANIVLLTSREVADISPILPAVDLLITDYSSVAFDFSLTGGALFFLAPDEELYADTRGLYEPYRDFSDGRGVRSWTEILAQLARYESDEGWAARVLAHSAALAERHFAHRDGLNTARVYDEILRRLRARR